MDLRIENGTDGKLIISNVRDFNLDHTFLCGQCFRWKKIGDNKYRGVVKDKILYLSNPGGDDGSLLVENSTREEFEEYWMEYFDLGTDYGKIKDVLSQKDPILKEAVEFGRGIRLLKQDFYETMVSFIISANNRIPMIMRVVEKIATTYGKPIEYLEDRDFSFPEAPVLAEADINELALCKGGFRNKYIIGSSALLDELNINPGTLRLMDTGAARELLKKLPGIGNKVADCILLYSGIKRDVFPTDVWVKRIMEELYLGRGASFLQIEDFARSYFGKYLSYAQQYLFYYARENRIGT